MPAPKTPQTPDRSLAGLPRRPRNPKRSELVARDLAAYIVDQDLPEGTALPPEREMVASLGVGRNTLREALRLLETRGVLTIRSGPGGGPIVRQPRPKDLAEALTLILQFEGASFSHVMDARTWLEPVVGRSAATRMKKADIVRLREANAKLAAATNDPDAFSLLNQRFHSIIAECCGNIVFQIFAETLLSIGDGRSIGISYAPRQISAIANAHERIIDALAAKDPEATEQAIRAHMDEANAYWRKRFGELTSQPVRWRH
jgi:DNA-binding FadR family transcriptional regulator